MVKRKGGRWSHRARHRGERAKAELMAWTKRGLLLPAGFFNTNFLYVARMAMSCSRGALSTNTRRLDPKRTVSWEFSAFSQNGEDGIIDYLLTQLTAQTRYFIEVGSADGLENNSSYLAFVKKYRGLMIEGDPVKSKSSARFLRHMNWGVEHLNMFVTPDRMGDLRQRSEQLDPDLFALDVDGIDYYIARAALEAGFRPKIICVEYNSAFGPEQSITVKYRPDFDYRRAHPTLLYYGASISAWKRLFRAWGYRFVTVDAAGVNAFFVDPGALNMESLEDVENIAFAENAAQRVRFGLDWEGQFEMIRHMEYQQVTASSVETRGSAA